MPAISLHIIARAKRVFQAFAKSLALPVTPNKARLDLTALETRDVPATAVQYDDPALRPNVTALPAVALPPGAAIGVWDEGGTFLGYAPNPNANSGADSSFALPPVAIPVAVTGIPAAAPSRGVGTPDGGSALLGDTAPAINSSGGPPLDLHAALIPLVGTGVPTRAPAPGERDNPDGYAKPQHAGDPQPEVKKLPPKAALPLDDATAKAKQKTVADALAAAKEFNALAGEVKAIANKRLAAVVKAERGIPHGIVEAMEKEGLATAHGGYTVVIERIGENGYFLAILEKGTYKDTYRRLANDPEKVTLPYFREFGELVPNLSSYTGGKDYTDNTHAHKLAPDPTKVSSDIIGGYRYAYFYSTYYKPVFSVERHDVPKEDVDRIMNDKELGKRLVARKVEFLTIEERKRVNSFLIDLAIDLIPGVNTADKIHKGNGWDIAIAVLEDGSVALGFGLLAKGAKATHKMKVASSLMMAGAAGVNFGKAGYEFRYGDQEKAVRYLTEAKLRLLGFAAVEIQQIRKAGTALKKLEQAAAKAANCFPEDTLVGTETGLRPIKTVNPGDRVWALDFGTGAWRLCAVERRHDSTFAGPVVTLDIGTSEVSATAGHPFWVIEGEDLQSRPVAGELPADEDRGGAVPGRWLDSQHLRAGDVILRRAAAPARIKNVTVRTDTLAVCNLTVTGLHTFAVGPDGVLVHNTSDSERVAQKALEAAQAAKGDTAAASKAAKEAEEIAAKAAAQTPAPRPGDPSLRWGNPKSKPTYGHTFLDHGQKVKDEQLIDRARTKDLNEPATAPHQIGAWNNDKTAADIIAEAVRGRKPGDVFDITIPAKSGRSFTGDSKALTADKARIVIGENGSVTTAYPFSSTGK